MTVSRRPPQAKSLARVILQEGEVYYSEPHALEEMKKDSITRVDCENVLRGGAYAEAEWENGGWRHQVRTGRFVVVIEFLSETELMIVTAWRLKP